MNTTTDSIAIDASTCPLCGNNNQCASEVEKATGVKQAPCWCTEVSFSAELLASVPEELKNRACICAACVAEDRKTAH